MRVSLVFVEERGKSLLEQPVRLARSCSSRWQVASGL